MQSKKKMIVNTVFLVVIFALTIYGVFHGEDLGAMMEAMRRADVRWLLPGLFCVVFFIWGESIIIWYMMHSFQIPVKKRTCFLFSSVGFFFSCITPSASGGQPMQLYYMKKGENISSGINGDSDDRHDHLQSGAGRGGTWACSVRTGLPAPVSDGNPSGFLSGNRSECLLCHSHAYSGFSSGACADNSGFGTENRGKTAFDETKRKPPEKTGSFHGSLPEYGSVSWHPQNGAGQCPCDYLCTEVCFICSNMVCIPRLPFIRHFLYHHCAAAGGHFRIG